MSNVNKGIKIFAWITGGLILILACLFIPVMKSYLYDPVITEQTVCYVYPKWNDVQLDSALHSVIPDEKSIPRVKRLLSFYKFDPSCRYDSSANGFEIVGGKPISRTSYI